jgi:hypothetical protein
MDLLFGLKVLHSERRQGALADQDAMRAVKQLVAPYSKYGRDSLRSWVSKFQWARTARVGINSRKRNIAAASHRMV